MSLNEFFQSKTFKGVLYGIGIIIVLLIVFQLGVFVGFKKAEFSGKWLENYYGNFAGPRREPLREFEGRDLMGGHGVFGSIIKVDIPNIIIKGSDNMEKIVVTNDKTEIMNMRNPIKIDELKADDNIVVIGSPNESGQIEAKLIRVMQSPPPGFPALPPQPFQGQNPGQETQIQPAIQQLSQTQQ